MVTATASMIVTGPIIPIITLPTHTISAAVPRKERWQISLVEVRLGVIRTAFPGPGSTNVVNPDKIFMLTTIGTAALAHHFGVV
jgi:hypothetical protein